MPRETKPASPARPQSSPRRVAAFAPGMERLEVREVPAVFNIANGDVAGLITAIQTANTNTEADTINLAAGGVYTLTAVNNNTAGDGANGLPVIVADANNAVTINGNGATIQRDPATTTPGFRLLAINNAVVSINSLNMFNGAAVSGGFSGAGDGGAIIVQGTNSRVSLDRMFFFNNAADLWGGAVSISGGNATISNSTLEGNFCVGNFNGGGGGISVNGGNTVNIINCTVTYNATNGQGGGIASSFTGPTNVLNIINTIVANNNVLPANSANTDIYRGSTTSRLSAINSIIRVPGTAFLGGAAINAANVGNTFNVDPVLGPLQNNGGTTLTRAPLVGSPAINGGTTAFLVGSFDQRNSPFARVIGGNVDIGALELQVIPPPVVVIPVDPDEVPIGSGSVSDAGIPDTPTPPGAPVPQTPQRLLVGSAPGEPASVRVLDPLTGAVLATYMPYGEGFTGGINVASGDVNGDGIADIVTAPASRGGSDIRVIDGLTGTQQAAFLAYEASFDGGASIAIADVDGDGTGDIITGAGAGGGPHVRVFKGRTYESFQSFLAYDSDFRGGVFVTAADFYNDGKADIVTSPGGNGGADVRIFLDGNPEVGRGNLLAADPLYRNGATVAAGDVNGDGLPDLIVGAGSRVMVYRNLTQGKLADFDALPGFTGGIRVAAIDTNGLGVSTIYVSPASDGPASIRAFNSRGDTLTETTLDGGTNGAIVG